MPSHFSVSLSSMHYTTIVLLTLSFVLWPSRLSSERTAGAQPSYIHTTDSGGSNPRGTLARPFGTHTTSYVGSHYLRPASPIHSALPISTNLEQHRANAKISSSPLNIDAPPTISAGRPCYNMETNRMGPIRSSG